jgi:8-amino-3,8-dideoxy-alpha-D-manno-octulosonate transaminase
MPGMEVYGTEERKEVNDVLETGALFRYGFDDLRKGMWKTKEFKDAEAMRLFISNNRIEWEEVFINNGYCIEYRYLRSI